MWRVIPAWSMQIPKPSTQVSSRAPRALQSKLGGAEFLTHLVGAYYGRVCKRSRIHPKRGVAGPRTYLRAGETSWNILCQFVRKIMLPICPRLWPTVLGSLASRKACSRFSCDVRRRLVALASSDFTHTLAAAWSFIALISSYLPGA